MRLLLAARMKLRGKGTHIAFVPIECLIPTKFHFHMSTLFSPTEINLPIACVYFSQETNKLLDSQVHADCNNAYKWQNPIHSGLGDSNWLTHHGSGNQFPRLLEWEFCFQIVRQAERDHQGWVPNSLCGNLSSVAGPGFEQQVGSTSFRFRDPISFCHYEEGYSEKGGSVYDSTNILIIGSLGMRRQSPQKIPYLYHLYSVHLHH